MLDHARRTRLRVPLVPFSLLLLCLAAPGCGGGGGGGGGDPTPALLRVSPDSALLTGSVFVTLTGSGFLDDSAGTTEVQIGAKATGVQIISDTELTCFVAAIKVGVTDVVLTNDNGSVRLADSFTIFTDPPVFRNSDVRLDTDGLGAGRSLFTKTCCDGKHVYVAWEDDRDGQFDVYFNHSADGGLTWQANDRRLDTDLAGAAHSADVQICCEGSAVYVTWHDRRDGTDSIHLNRSTDGGSTWLTSDVRVNDAAGAYWTSSSRLCCEG